MIDALKPYAEYKESGVPWLGKIPKHWQALPNRTLFAEVKDRNHPNEPLLSVTIGKGIIRQSDLLANSSKKDSSNEDKAKYKLVQPRDIAYNKMRAWQGAVGVSNYRGIVSPAYIVIRPRGEQNPDYFHYLLRTPAFAKEAERWSYGISSDQWSLRADDFKQIYCSLPPKEEQDCIVKFIAHKDRRINRFIHDKRRLIELLNEQKQVTTHRAVTCGLDPNVRLKPSGIEWLGDVPEQWEVRQLKQLLLRMDYGTSENLAHEGLIRVLTMGHIQDGQIVLPEKGSLSSIPSELVLDHNDLLFNRTNSPELVGKVGIFLGSSSEQVSFASYLVRLRVEQEHDPRWLNYLLNSNGFWNYAKSQALISLHQANLNSTRYGRMLLPLPPKQQQTEISDYLNEQTEQIERSIVITRHEIDLLREYRTRLISDVVTGKLDVRGVVIPAMDVAETLEDIDTDEDTDTEAEDLIESEEVTDADE